MKRNIIKIPENFILNIDSLKLSEFSFSFEHLNIFLILVSSQLQKGDFIRTVSIGEVTLRHPFRNRI